VLVAFDRRHLSRFRGMFHSSFRGAGNPELLTVVAYGLAPSEADALRLLSVATGVGYEPMLGTLAGRRAQRDAGMDPDTPPVRDVSPRQFVFNDGAGGIERIRVDFGGEHLAGLRAALETAPQAGRRPAPALSEAPAMQQVHALAAVGASNGRAASVDGPARESEIDFDPTKWGESS